MIVCIMVENNPLVTIVTPVFKKRSTINDTIKSILIQDYNHIEYIVIDDGPGSVVDEQIKTLCMDLIPLRIIHNCTNLGISESLNKAVEHANGKYIVTIADDDCLYESNTISKLVDEFESSGADIIVGRCAMFNNDLSVCIFTDSEEDWISYHQKNGSLFDELSGYNKILGCVTMKTRQYLKTDEGRYDSEYKLIEDYPFILKAVRNNVEIHFFNSILIKYRSGGRSSFGNISMAYLIESNTIFKNEVYPYSKHKFYALSSYCKWVAKVILFKICRVFRVR